MQTKNFFFILIFSFISIITFAQSNQLPTVNIKTLDGQTFSTADFDNDGKPYVLSFWATWCRPCLKELTAIDEIYEDWLELGVKLVAVSTDDSKTRNNVLPMVNGRAWKYDFFIDENGDFKRAMGVNMIPHTFIIDGKGNVVAQHRAFYDGLEWEMYDKLEKLIEEAKDIEENETENSEE